ncbi:TPA_asm: matrix protein [little skate bornavirus]|uniref:Matrix protein n=1 Tax=little skate bornavirus TaxID=3055759 RepID=A0AA48PAQ6_9MONO|nr:TPA_asm: matrix protein [little skate bornavirus]
MPKGYPYVDPKDALVPGYTSLLLVIKFRKSSQTVVVALASVSSHFLVPSLPAGLTIDLEPYGADTAVMYYQWEDATWNNLSKLLVKPKGFPQRGAILIGEVASQHAFFANFNVDSFHINNVGTGPLGIAFSKR